MGKGVSLAGLGRQVCKGPQVVVTSLFPKSGHISTSRSSGQSMQMGSTVTARKKLEPCTTHRGGGTFIPLLFLNTTFITFPGGTQSPGHCPPALQPSLGHDQARAWVHLSWSSQEQCLWK